jgi:hypothetical protein
MSGPTQINDQLLLTLFHMHEDGYTLKQLTQWLQQAHHIKVSFGAIATRLRRLKQIAKQAQTDAIKESAREDALDYVSIIKRNIVQLDKKCAKLMQSENKEDLYLAKALQQNLLQFISKQLDISEVNKTQDTNEEVLDSLLDNMADPINDNN